MHVVYHKTLDPKIVTAEEFHSMLNSREWFDRPQKTLEGNSDERERLLDERKERHQSREKRQDDGRLCCDSAIQREPSTGASGDGEIRVPGGQESSERQSGSIKKKRGRPARKQVDFINEQLNT